MSILELIPLLPSVYLGPIDYYGIIANSNEVIIEQHENFVKQSYRNRCHIYAANGLLKLAVPIRHKGERQIVKDVVIANDEQWQKLHWKSICTAYRSSPYFEYYEDDFAPFYEKEYKFLMDLNRELCELITGLLGIELTTSQTTSYEANPEGVRDLRSSSEDQHQEKNERYLQVFESKHGFIPNLSIIDLLFNLGPQASEYLDQK